MLAETLANPLGLSLPFLIVNMSQICVYAAARFSYVIFIATSWAQQPAEQESECGWGFSTVCMVRDGAERGGHGMGTEGASVQSAGRGAVDVVHRMRIERGGEERIREGRQCLGGTAECGLPQVQMVGINQRQQTSGSSGGEAGELRQKRSGSHTPQLGLWAAAVPAACRASERRGSCAALTTLFKAAAAGGAAGAAAVGAAAALAAGLRAAANGRPTLSADQRAKAAVRPAAYLVSWGGRQAVVAGSVGRRTAGAAAAARAGAPAVAAGAAPAAAATRALGPRRVAGRRGAGAVREAASMAAVAGR